MKNDAGTGQGTAGGVLVCFAMEEEAGAFRKIMRHKTGVSILVTGIGQKNAEKAVRDFLAAQTPARVLSCGFAGALISELSIGEVVFETDDVPLREKLTAAGARPVKFHCADRIATTAREKQELRRSTNADAVEMESDIIAFVCKEYSLPCATVRVISDAADEDLPLDFNRLSKPDRSMDYGKLAWAVAKSPGKIGALRRLQKQTRFAADQLAGVLAKIIFL
jgi:adenosylhomocysteine nucleosidase